MVTPLLISVIVPSYNHEAFVVRAIGSVFHQTHKAIELIVIDDASTDNSQALIAHQLSESSFRKRFDGRITYIPRVENLGACATINQGLAIAKGEYIAILNSDDLYMPDRLEVMLSALQKEQKSFAFSRVDFIDDAGKRLSDADDDYYTLSRVQNAIVDFPSLGFAVLNAQCGLSTGNFLFSREMAERLGGFREYIYCHDWDFILRTMLIEEPMYVDKALYLYRIHGRNSFRDLSGIADAETTDIITQIFSQMIKGEYENPLPPSPQHWPGVFESFLRYCGYEKYWKKAQLL